VRAMLRARRRATEPQPGAQGDSEPRSKPSHSARLALTTVALCAGALVLVVVVLAGQGGRSNPAPADQGLGFNPVLDPGTPLAGAAPQFTLTDQFGRSVSLRSFRGKVVILGFTDSECTTVCPLTTTAMVDAKTMLGSAANRVQLLGIDANPTATSRRDVFAYSELHGMLRQWDFLTGTLPQLRRVWGSYHIEAAVVHGKIDHTPALFVIGPQGTREKVYITQMAYSAIPQAAQLLAQEASSLLPGHPRVHSHLSYARAPATTPDERVSLARSGGGRVLLGPGGAARLLLFFDTWDRGTTSLARQLDALNSYDAAARRLHLPTLTAVDEASVEPSSGALPEFLRSLPHPLDYPVAIDRTGRLADGYEVQDQPWLTVVSPTGRLLWYRDVSVGGWPDTSVLVHYVRAALAWGAAAQANNAALAARALSGSPPPLAALHAQASKLVGAESGFANRLRALRGYPVVINAWASWCTPCRSEFGLFAAASSRYGRRVAFLGADSDDSAGDARAFLAQHHVSYPSYQTSPQGLSSLAVIEGLPTTIFINRAGKVVFVHTGQYDSLGSLYQDIQNYAL
jgi:cytochrome oxidase Cu insertion factor (SCO1/SenC/PrrC family)/thiol-disulfide isomerase/thioredoxin